jgi:ribonuclease HI
LRKRYGGLDYRQTRLVEDVISGEKLTLTYDPTQRMTQVDPDVEAEITGADKVVPGDPFIRTVTWVWPNGTTTIIDKFNLPVRATPQDFMLRLCKALKIPELNYRFTTITPENWRYARAIRVEFAYERPELGVLREATEKIFKEDYGSTCPTFIETDGACAGNDHKQSPGGWGAISVNGPRMLKRFGAKADTSNNEMECRAMLEALEFVPTPAGNPALKPLVVMETDSQLCIDGLTKYRKRWEAHRWKKDDGKLVENADLIQLIAGRIDKMHVGFWKIKGHTDDPWNDLADALAVQGRNQSKSEVIVQVLFRPTVDGKEKFWAIPRLSLNPNANIHDFWSYLVDKFGRHGEPEDYEIWNEHKPLEGPLIHGLGYEIVPRTSPGHFKPQERRNSADLSVKALVPVPQTTGTLSPLRTTAKDWSPRPLIRTNKPAREVPPQWRVQVVYQAYDAPEKEGRSWFTEEDTEYAIERRARSSLGIIGAWRRLLYWRDNT